jgi:hypothetical protein
VWYRGTPSGVPQLNDLAAIRARGFHHVVWPAAYSAQRQEVQRLAELVDLEVLAENADVDRSATPAVVTVAMTGVNRQSLPALLWRAAARGARIIQLDFGAGRPDDDAAVRFARQMSSNPSLFEGWRAGPPISVESGAHASVEVMLFDAGTSWILVATNVGELARTLSVRLVPRIPYALWVSLLDATTMSMRDDAEGPLWIVDLAPGAAAAYVIDKDLK